MQDTSKIKERIVNIINSEGPNFPSPIASKIQTSILFTSAFLSELLSEKKVKITHMKVGSSPIYYLPEQEEKLEAFATKYLKSKEKDAFVLLKEKKILEDLSQDPAIRVALRSIRDFAIPEEKNDKLYWKYFLNKEEISTKEIKEEKSEERNKNEPVQKDEASTSQKETLKIFDKNEPLEIDNNKNKEEPKRQETKEKAKKKTFKKKSEPKVNEKFFNKVKDYLRENKIEISDIVSFSKTDVTLKVKENSEEYLLIAYNKKTIREEDIIKAFKIAESENLEYEILSLGEPLKKISAFIEALKKIKEIRKIE